MRIGVKIIVGLVLIAISGAVSGYLQMKRSQKSLNSMNAFAYESIPELLRNHEITVLTEEMIVSSEIGDNLQADSLFTVIMSIIGIMEESEKEDDDYDEIVNNVPDELKLLYETKESIVELHKVTHQAYHNGSIIDEGKAEELLILHKKFSDKSLERMRSEILEFENSRIAAEKILKSSQVESTTIIVLTALLALLTGLYISKSITYPLIKLEKAMEKVVSSGNMEEIKTHGSGEMRKLIMAFNIMMVKIKDAFKVQGELNRELSNSNTHLMETKEEIQTQKEKIEEQNIMLLKAKEELENINHTLESKVSERTRELTDTIHKLNKTVSELDRFVYSASHDLSAPLKSVLGLINISKFETEPDNLLPYMEKIETSVLKLEDVIKNLIDFSRNARTETRIELIEIDELINECLADLSYEKELSSIEIKNDIEHLPTAYTDRQRLRVILRNLLSNAIKYQDLSKSQHCITIKSQKDEDSWSLYVEDNGIGIKDEYLDNVFKMFYRATEQSNGSGLGLYIVQESVKKLDGTIKIHSKYGKGTRFQIKFPDVQQTVVA